MKYYLLSSQMMHKSQFHRIDTYDWFCGPGHILSLSEEVKESFLVY